MSELVYTNFFDAVTGDKEKANNLKKAADLKLMIRAAKDQRQIDYYAGNLIEGAVVTVSGESIAVEEFQGQQGLVITLALNNARIEYIAPPSQVRAPDAAQQAYNQGASQPAQNQKVPPNHGFDSFDDELNF